MVWFEKKRANDKEKYKWGKPQKDVSLIRLGKKVAFKSRL